MDTSSGVSAGAEADRRQFPRRMITKAANIKDPVTGSRFSCVVCDISTGGARLFLARNLDKGLKAELLVYDDEVPRLCEVMWSRDDFTGVRFAEAYAQ